MKNRNGCFAVVMCILVFCFIATSAYGDLVGLWRFDEADGNDVFDSSAYGHDGVAFPSPFHKGLSGGVEVNNTDPCRITHAGYGNAMEFGTLPDGTYPDSDNTNWNYVYIPHSETLANLGATWSIAFWVKQYVNNPDLLTKLPDPNGAGYQRVISCPHFEYELGIPADMHDYFWPYYESGGTPYFQTAIGATQATGSWYHVALVYDGTDLIKYINGIEQTRLNIPGKSLPDSFASWEYLRFGAQTYPVKDYFIGALDDVAVFNQALQPNEVNEVRDGNFAGPWVEYVYETDTPSAYIWDSTFIAQKDSIALDFGDKRIGDAFYIPSWNWRVGGDTSDPNLYGLVNAGLLDGNAISIEYAAYTTVDTNIIQPKPLDYQIHRRIHKDTKYDFKTRVAGEDAVNNVIGVRFYAANVNDPNNRTLLANLNQTIATNGQWYELSGTFTADEANYPDTNMTFEVECYVEEGTGNPRGTAFGWFDYVRIDVNEFFTCDALYYYYGDNPDLPYDLIEDCRTDFKDYAVLAGSNGNNPEPSIEVNELLVNSDLFQNLSDVPDNGDYVIDAPTGWSFDPAPGDVNDAGIWNVDRNGYATIPYYYQPAGGSVAAYIKPDINLVQVIDSPTIENGKTYYVSTMVGCSDANDGTSPYLSFLRVKLERVDPITYTNPVQVAEVNWVLPHIFMWRALTTEFTAGPTDVGKCLRLTYDLAPNPITGDVNGLAVIGQASISDVEPSVWPRQNLLTNGDFEDYESLPTSGNPGDHINAIDLFDYLYGGWTQGMIPGWDASSNPAPPFYGLQCMYWAPSPQPAQGRIAAWCQQKIEQEVTSEPIEGGETYYLDFIGAINAAAYGTGDLTVWDANDANLVVEVYWTDNGGSTLNYITELREAVSGPLVGNVGTGIPYGFWISPEMSFEAPMAGDGENFYVIAYSDGFSTMPYVTFEEIFLSKEPRLQVGAYTCYELRNKYGDTVEADFNEDCDVDIEDVALFVVDWLKCNNPEGCN